MNIDFKSTTKLIIYLIVFLFTKSIYAQNKEAQSIEVYKQIADLDKLFKFDNSKATYSQTANWIVDKLNSYYMVNYFESYDSDNILYEKKSENIKVTYFKVSIVDKKIIFRKDYNVDSYVKYNGDFFGSTNNYNKSDNLEIRIEDLKSVRFQYNDLMISYFNSEATGGYSTYYVKINNTKEINLNNRVIDAFIHLKHLVKPIKKEVF